jgi:glycosyltransferase involved in cell wall biosynthesis
VRVLHLSNDLYPDVLGGTEIFVARLIEAQRRSQGIASVAWAAHGAVSPGGTLESSEELLRLPPIVRANRTDAFSARASDISGFEELLVELRPDVVHMHSFSEACGLSHARAAKDSGAHLVVTVHAPGFSCASGTLIDMGGKVCDGRLRARRCTSCRLQSGGLPRPAAAVASVQRGRWLPVDSEDRVMKVLTFRRLIEAYHAAWLEFAGLVDAIHVNARWHAEVLEDQGIEASRIHHIPTAGPGPLPRRRREPMEDGVLRVVYWGRCESVKGIHLVVDAIRSLPDDFPISFDIFTEGWDRPYGRQVLAQIGGDVRIRRRAPVAQAVMLHRLQDFDLAVVPSTWLETGPMTVLEAFAAGLPVAGSPLGGIAERLAGVPGTFTVPAEAEAWAELFRRLVARPELLEAFEPPRMQTFDNTAESLLAGAYRPPGAAPGLS